MVWVSSAAPAKSMWTASTPDKSEIRMVWASTAVPAKEYADCLYSRQVRNYGMDVLRGTCNRVCRLPLLQTSQKSEWPGCPPRHLQQSMRTASAPVLFESCQVRI